VTAERADAHFFVSRPWRSLLLARNRNDEPPTISSLSGEKQTCRGHRECVAFDPYRHFATVNWCIAKGSSAVDIGLLRHGVLLVFRAPCQLRSLAGQDHGRTIPLADISENSLGSNRVIAPIGKTVGNLARDKHTYGCDAHDGRCDPAEDNDRPTSRIITHY
jgi:hypothetical protein